MEAASTQMSYTFRGHATPEEGVEALSVLQGSDATRKRFFAISFALVCFVVGGFLVLQPGTWAWLGAAPWLGTGGATTWRLLTSAEPTGRNRHAWDDALRVTVYTFDQNGIASGQEDVTRYVRWHAITEIRANKRVIVFMRGIVMMAFMPASVFRSAEERSDFLDFARAQIALAQAAAVRPAHTGG
jgi:hypothetical protein